MITKYIQRIVQSFPIVCWQLIRLGQVRSYVKFMVSVIMAVVIPTLEHEEQFESVMRTHLESSSIFSNPEISSEKSSARPKVQHIKPIRALSRVPRTSGSLPTKPSSEYANLTEIQKMKNKKVLQSVVQIELAIGLIDHCTLYPSVT